MATVNCLHSNGQLKTVLIIVRQDRILVAAQSVSTFILSADRHFSVLLNKLGSYA